MSRRLSVAERIRTNFEVRDFVLVQLVQGHARPELSKTASIFRRPPRRSNSNLEFNALLQAKSVCRSSNNKTTIAYQGRRFVFNHKGLKNLD